MESKIAPWLWSKLMVSTLSISSSSRMGRVFTYPSVLSSNPNIPSSPFFGFMTPFSSIITGGNNANCSVFVLVPSVCGSYSIQAICPKSIATSGQHLLEAIYLNFFSSSTLQTTSNMLLTNHIFLIGFPPPTPRSWSDKAEAASALFVLTPWVSWALLLAVAPFGWGIILPTWSLVWHCHWYWPRLTTFSTDTSK